MEKLIRDKIPQIAALRGETLKTRIASQEEMPDLLRRKLREEVEELIAAPQDEIIEEAADVMEAIFSYCRAMGLNASLTALVGMEKTAERGTFDRGVVLVDSDA